MKHTEEEFKTLLKNLFAEKYKVQELQKKLTENEEQEESVKAESSEVSELKERIEKIKPALQQLISELKTAKEKIDLLQKEKEEIVEEKKRQEKLLLILEDERKNHQDWQEEKERVEKEFEGKKGLEEEKQKLIERLSETLTHLQKQHDINKDLKEEVVSLHRELKQAQSEKKKLEEAQEITDQNNPAFIENYEKKIEEIEKEKEETLSKSYQELKKISLKNATLEEELKKAHLHIGKKIKETALLRNSYEKQKTKIAELHTHLQTKSCEIETLEKSLSYLRSHEEKVDRLTKEKIEAMEFSLKEWQEKYHDVHKVMQTLKEENAELMKMKVNYEKLLFMFSSFKEILAKFSIDDTTTN